MNKVLLFSLFYFILALQVSAQEDLQGVKAKNQPQDLMENFSGEGKIHLISLQNNAIAFGKGVIGGLVLAMLLGPVFFALIRTSLDKGFVSGAYLAVGVALSDACVAMVIYSGVSQFSGSNDFRFVLGAAGGVLMMIFGVIPFIKPVQKSDIKAVLPKGKGYFRKFMQGIFLNILNPFVYFFWIGIIGSVGLEASNTNIQVFFFILGIVVTVLCTDLLKVFVANRISNFLTPNIINTIDRIAGIGLIGFGFRLLYFASYGK